MNENKPTIGEERTAKELGVKGHGIYIYVECPMCFNQRWAQRFRYIKSSKFCRKCWGKTTKGKNHARWKDGRYKDSFGYIRVKLYKGDFFYSMGNNNHYVAEHRLVVAKSLGRCLHNWEIVHHKNHIKDNNRLDNLQLVGDNRHKQITIMENRIRFLESRVTNLEAEIVLLKSQPIMDGV